MSRLPGSALAVRSLLAVVAVALALTGSARSHSASLAAAKTVPSTTPAALRTYLAQVEAVRLPVNAILEDASPILDGFHAYRLTRAQASARMGDFERSFAAYALQMAQIASAGAALAAINTPYAQADLYEDSSLATLAADLTDSDFDFLPNTQAARRLAIIEWRTRLEVLAAKLAVTLPADIQQAGRGELAPGPQRS